MPGSESFASALVSALRRQGQRPATSGAVASTTTTTTTTWMEVADGVRLLALGLVSAGVGGGHRVQVDGGAARPHDLIGRELAVLSVGAVLCGPGADCADAGFGPNGLSGVGPETIGLDDLRDRGAAADRDRPARYEEMLSALGRAAPAIATRDAVVTQGQARWALRSVDRWIGAALPSADGVVGGVVVDGPGPVLAAHRSVDTGGITAALVGRWWPATVGAALAGIDADSGGPGGVVDAARDLRPSLAVLDPTAWAELAAAARTSASWSLAGPTLLRRGRVIAAGESSSLVDRIGLTAARRWIGLRVNTAAGLDRLDLGVCLGPLDPGAARDLAAAAVPLVVAWTAPGATAPVAATPVLRPEPAAAWGRPLPGRAVEVVGPITTILGGDLPDGRLCLDGAVAVDDRSRVRFPRSR